jgi:hypothetical protein
MKQTPGTRRSSLVAATALCALALTACGTTKADGSGATAQPRPAKTVDAAAAPKPQAEPDPLESEPELAYMVFLTKVAQPCFPGLPTAPPPADEEEAAAPPAYRGSLPPAEPPLPSGPPSPDELNPGNYRETEEDKKAEAEQEAGLKCVATAHVDRVTKAVKGLKDPAEVRQALVKSGYLGTRVTTSTVPAAGTGFSVDLRMWGSTTCLSGTVSGAAPAVRPREVLDPEAPCPRP